MASWWRRLHWQLPLLPLLVQAASQTGYTTNAICRERNCINPLFPGYTDLSVLQATTWQCTAPGASRSYMDFCKNAVNYDVAVPSPAGGTQTLESLIQAQENAAATAYFYHLAGMSLDALGPPAPVGGRQSMHQGGLADDLQHILSEADCWMPVGPKHAIFEALWKRVYKYMMACEVQCCDESSKCPMAVSASDGKISGLQAYAAAEGPSNTCTGDAARYAEYRLKGLPLLVVLVGFAIEFEG
eukprot:CAMPEP_0117493360 /NCGR_PEP_ID=MMETSP0784-20121206/19058_1 /TAXON_ID=39447 /ORGANISM="" /LENGTH=242 /DNA_ID=CAMNT_0005288211 /DNA_START=135 /DNA_END=860 /DNA_ORIENTATION=+